MGDGQGLIYSLPEVASFDQDYAAVPQNLFELIAGHKLVIAVPRGGAVVGWSTGISCDSGIFMT